MILRYIVALVFSVLIALVSCSPGVKSEAKGSYNDSLLISYIDIFLIGRQIFPLKQHPIRLEELIDSKVLLSFRSDSYYYCFYNRKADLNFLDSRYWNKKIPKYLKKLETSDLNRSKFIRVDYDGPFLTGFYNPEDSIIVLSAELKDNKLDSVNELRVNYFSTNDTTSNGLINSDIKSAISELRISDNLQQRTKYRVVLMEATSQVDNAWYNSCEDCHSEYSNAIVLCMTGNEIVQMQYLDSEYIDYLFKKKNIRTKDIHY